MFTVAWLVLLLPLAGVGLSYLAETRRGIASAAVFTSWLALAAALVLLGAVVAAGRVVHTDTLTFWSFQVVQDPFNAVHGTLLGQTFMVGLGYAATPTAAVLAVLVTLITLLCELQMMVQFRRDPRLGRVIRLGNLLSFGALLLVLAPELFQDLVGFEICGLAAAVLVGSALNERAGAAARSGYLIWRAGGLSLLLGVGFIYVKFSGAIANAAAAVAAAAAKHKVVPPTPDGLNLTALDRIWVATTKGLVHGAGGRSLTLAAVLVVVAAACACSLFPAHGLGRNLGSAPGAASGLVLAIAGGVVGVTLLVQTFTLLRWASGILPTLVALATLTSLGAAVLAFREHRLRRLASWLAVSQVACCVTGIGLGSPAAALALLISSGLGTAALLGAVSALGRDQRVDSIDQLGAAWRLARPSVLLLLAALAALTGVVGLGTFFGHTAVLAAAFGAGGHSVPRPPTGFRVLAGVGQLLTMVVLAGAVARVALIAIRGQESADPREARLVRRQLAQGRGLRPLAPTVALTALALVSGLVSLPGISFGLGRFLSSRPGTTALPWQPLAFLLVLVLPLLALGLMAVRRRQLAISTESDPLWLGWADGSRLARVADTLGFGVPGRALAMVQTKALAPARDTVSSGAVELGRLEPPQGGPHWSLASSLVTLAALALAVGLIIWAVTGSHSGVGLP